MLLFYVDRKIKRITDSKFCFLWVSYFQGQHNYRNDQRNPFITINTARLTQTAKNSDLI